MICLACNGAFCTSNPSTFTMPEVGFNKPTIVLIVVVLPAPFGPKNPKNWPSGIVRLMFDTAVIFP